MTTKNFMQNSHGPTHYTYNANGAVVTDANKCVVYTEYDSMSSLEMYDYGARLYNGQSISKKYYDCLLTLFD